MLARGDCEEKQNSLDSRVYLRIVFSGSWMPWECPLRGRFRAHGHMGPSMAHAMVEHFVALEVPAVSCNPEALKCPPYIHQCVSLFAFWDDFPGKLLYSSVAGCRQKWLAWAMWHGPCAMGPPVFSAGPCILKFVMESGQKLKM